MIDNERAGEKAVREVADGDWSLRFFHGSFCDCYTFRLDLLEKQSDRKFVKVEKIGFFDVPFNLVTH